jgi:flagellar hook assembly protein FlgD/outer membrane protein OmpA-like peptidoglycan-associated protein
LIQRIIVKLLLICFVVTVPVFGEYEPPNGAENLLDYLSPTFYGGGSSVTGHEGPQADSLNPAVSGSAELATVDFSYFTIADFTGGEGWGGHLVNLGSTLPTRAGVFAWSGHFIYSQLSQVDLGIIGSANFSFSKNIYENLFVGIGLGTSVGSNDSFDWSLEGDLGFLHFINTEKLHDARWGVVLRDFGKGFKAAAGKTAYPSPFSLLGGFAFSAIQTEAVDLGFTFDLGFPSFQNIRLGLGINLNLFDVAGLQIATTYDLQELLKPEISTGSFIPTFGLSFSFQTAFTKESDFLGLAEKGLGKNDVKIQTAAGPVSTGVWGIGLGINARLGQRDSRPPVVSIDYPSSLYMSINNDDVQDNMSFGIDFEDERFILGYEYTITDAGGNTIRSAGNNYLGPESEGFQEVLDRLMYVDTSIQLPDELTWDGKNEDGKPVKDGTYYFSVKAWDDNRNTGNSETYEVYIDSTPPVVEIAEIAELDKIFSPNNDGNKDRMFISQTGSIEDLWIGVIEKEGIPVKSYRWENQAPVDFIWDGVTDEGTLANDGVYKYSVTAADRGGNTSIDQITDIVLNTQATPITLSIDKSHFSPNGDGKYDDVLVSINIPIKAGIKDWVLNLVNDRGDSVRLFSGSTQVPETVTFDGTDMVGSALPEGNYHAELDVIYLNGNKPHNQSPVFVLDVTPPEATVTLDLPVFSPNGDRNKDIITFFQETSVEDEWNGVITNNDGIGILRYSWRETADSKITWDGQALGGLIAPDGTYGYQIFSEDRAGNSGVSKKVSFRLNTEATTVLISREFDAISPNSDSVKDFQNFLPQVSIKEGIDTFYLRVYSEDGDLIRSYTGRQDLADSYKWEGLADDGSRAADGEYFGQLEIHYENGNKPLVNTNSFVIDTVYPKVSSEPDKKLFSPNGDGNKDTVTFRNSSSFEDLWEARIVNDAGDTVRRVFWKDTVSSYVWDGSDDTGNRAPDGVYTFEIFTADISGNYSYARSAGVNLDTRSTSIVVTAEPQRFSPNGDGFLEEITFNTFVGVRDGVSGWNLTIFRRNGAVVSSFDGTRIPEKIIWDGKDNTGTVTDGEYFARFNVDYEMGNKPVTQTEGFVVDISSPDAEVRFDPKPFSPDSDGFEDRLNFTILAQDDSDIASWNLAIFDTKGNVFKEYGGPGAPRRNFFWNGYSSSNELVLAAEDYPYEFVVEDVLGNSTRLTGSIPIDVLVIREGDRLKIRISNITFEPNSPTLETSDSEVMEKNNWVLERISEIFKKYASYFIRIEGHAVSVYWENAERAAIEQADELVPLSRERAQTVRDVLVKYGIDPERIQVEGIGGAQPIVPHSDLDNRWKNRRVEFILLK